jgi:serine/threonine protein phosphatase 1
MVNIIGQTGVRSLAIGDIHGCRAQLRDLLSQVSPTRNDRLVFLGDYVDRGPDSAGVIDDLLALRAHLPETVFLRGNHEEMLLDVLAGHDPATFLFNGGDRTIASYRARGEWPPPAEHRLFLEKLLPVYQDGEFIFVHAGLRPGLPLTAQQTKDLLWIRGEFLHSDYDWGKPVVFGHTPRREPLLEDNRIGLDTGCVYGGPLTCCELRTRFCWQSD